MSFPPQEQCGSLQFLGVQYSSSPPTDTGDDASNSHRREEAAAAANSSLLLLEADGDILEQEREE